MIDVKISMVFLFVDLCSVTHLKISAMTMIVQYYLKCNFQSHHLLGLNNREEEPKDLDDDLSGEQLWFTLFCSALFMIVSGLFLSQQLGSWSPRKVTLFFRLSTLPQSYSDSCIRSRNASSSEAPGNWSFIVSDSCSCVSSHNAISDIANSASDRAFGLTG